MMTRDLLLGTPRSLLAGGVVRIRRMAFLFETKPFIVSVPPARLRNHALGRLLQHQNIASINQIIG